MSQDDVSNSPPEVVPTDAPPDAAPPRLRVVRTAALLVVALLVCLVGYLAVALPGPWFPSASPLAFPASGLSLTRGSGQIVDGELVIQSPDPSGLTIVSELTDFRAPDYPAIAWIGIGFSESADVRLLWRTSYAPERLNSTPIAVESGRLMPVIVAKHPQWIGTITGVALAIRGPLPQPVRLRGVVAKPMGALEVLQDRAREWFAFESWNGTSINALNGGAEVQPLPLPLLLACAAGLAIAVAAALLRWRPGSLGASLPIVVAGVFVAAWLLLDLRWTGNLVRQARATAEQFGGKSLRDKHLAGEDAALFAFVDRAKEVMPATPVRVFVAAEPEYFRLRAAYHLYPHSVFSPRGEELPRASDVKPGDWFLVYRRRGIQYDAARHVLRWDDGQTASADVKLVEPGGALFVIK